MIRLLTPLEGRFDEKIQSWDEALQMDAAIDVFLFVYNCQLKKFWMPK